MSLKRRVTCPLVRSKSFHLSSTEGKTAPPLLNTHTLKHTSLSSNQTSLCVLHLLCFSLYIYHWNISSSETRYFRQLICKVHTIATVESLRLSASDRCSSCRITVHMQAFSSLKHFFLYFRLSYSLPLSLSPLLPLTHGAMLSGWYPWCCQSLQQHKRTGRGLCKQ